MLCPHDRAGVESERKIRIYLPPTPEVETTLLEGGDAFSHSGGSMPCHANRTTRLLSLVGSRGSGEIPGIPRSSTNSPPPTCCSNIRCTPHVTVARTCAISWRGFAQRSQKCSIWAWHRNLHRSL